jgi:hypothetical protein
VLASVRLFAAPSPAKLKRAREHVLPWFHTTQSENAQAGPLKTCRRQMSSYSAVMHPSDSRDDPRRDGFGRRLTAGSIGASHALRVAPRACLGHHAL